MNILFLRIGPPMLNPPWFQLYGATPRPLPLGPGTRCFLGERIGGKEVLVLIGPKHRTVELVSARLGYELCGQASSVAELRVGVVGRQLHFRHGFLIGVKDHLIAEATGKVCNTVDQVLVVGKERAVHDYLYGSPTWIFTGVELKNAFDGARNSLIQVSSVVTEGGQSIDLLLLNICGDVGFFRLATRAARRLRLPPGILIPSGA